MDDDPSRELSELAEIAATEARLAALARGETPPAEAYVPTPTEIERSAEFASKVRPPFKAIRVSRESGAIVGVVRWARTPIVRRPVRRQFAPRHRHAARRARSRSPSRRSDGDDPEPDLAVISLAAFRRDVRDWLAAS